MSKDIWVFADVNNGKIIKITYELLGKAVELAQKTGGSVVAVLLGHNVSSLAGELAHYGASKVFVADHESLANYGTLPYTKVVADLIKEHSPAMFLSGNTFNGKDLNPRVAGRLDAGAISEVISLDCDSEGKATAVRPIYAGKFLETVTFNSFPQLIGVRNKAFPIKDADTSKTAEIVNVAVEAVEPKVKLKETITSTSNKISLADAEIVVSAGRGLRGPENLYLVEDLAKVFGAAVGASRPVVDDGWIEYDSQVGQTGKVVSPKLYIACGISGAIQHLAGMSSSKYVVAINKDAEAPIFKVADYGIVGDVFEILPALTAEVKKVKAN
ncbi:MAG: electron transfer flavoprotein subunit alpha/FixB family protein [Candidatus Sericytochromatia bacterium]